MRLRTGSRLPVSRALLLLTFGWASASGNLIEPPPSADLSRGEALFHGHAPLSARLRLTNGQPLPRSTLACINCHTGRRGAEDLPALDAKLSIPTPRRGGPSSAYDSASLCRLLNTGIDPANVIVERAMPQYTMDASDCQALWAYISSRNTGAGE